MNARQSQLHGRNRLARLREYHEATGEEMAEERKRYNALAGREAAPVVVSSFNLFPTPPEIARRVVELAKLSPSHTILEPSCGTGRLLDAVYERPFAAVPNNGNQVWMIDIEPACVTACKNRFPCAHGVTADFLTLELSHRFDRIIMNPPFHRGEDIKHIRRALGLLRPGGCLVAICASGAKREQAFADASEWHELPAGSFRSEGTNVGAAIVVYNA